MAFAIIRHALQMIFRNISEALRVSIGPFVIGFLLVGVILSASGSTGSRPAAALGVLFTVLVLMVVFSWTAVSWHRFILLEERVDLLPKFRMTEIGPYVQIVFLLILISGACMLPVLLAAQSITGLLGNAGDLLISFVIGLVPIYLLFRLGMTLPAAAVGKEMAFRKSWDITRGANATLWGVAAILVVVNLLVELWSSIPLSPSAGHQILQLTFAIGLNWLTLMLSVCVLTTFYGHLVEGRELAG